MEVVPESHGFFFQALVYLTATVVAVPLSKRLGLGSVIGYLLAGIAIGPSGMKLIPSVEEVMHFAEFGVVMLLFVIGLELNPKKLWEMKKPILGTGGLQVLSAIAVFSAIGLFSGLSWPVALVASMGFALSSTAIALQLLRERKLMNTLSGETAFSVLLFQDLAVIPMIAVLPLLATRVAGASEPSAWLSVGKSVLAILVVVVGGRTVLKPVFRYIAKTDLREIFTAFSLFLVVVVASLMQAVGLSMALGAFLAGVLLSDSEYRHELESDIEPFKGLLLGLFFISVGMSVNLGILFASPLKVIALVIGFVLVKGLLLWGVALLFKLCRRDGVIFAFSLSQGGEFAFVLFTSAVGLGILSTEQSGLFVLVVALSMLTTSFLMIVDEKWIAPLFAETGGDGLASRESVKNENSPVILAGFGRFGQVVGRMLHSKGIATTILDRDANQIDLVQKFGWKAFYGDVSRVELLHAAGASSAKLLILAIDDMEASLKTALLVREHFPNLKVMARVESRPDAYVFMSHGIQIFRETMGSALEMGEAAFEELGYSAFEAKKTMLKFKHYDLKMLKESAKHVDDEETLMNMSRHWREELVKLMQQDEKRSGPAPEKEWS